MPAGGKMEITVSDVLSTFSKISGVSGVAVVSHDGFIIESTMDTTINGDALGALLATEFTRLEDIGQEFKLGELDQYVTDYANGSLLLVKMPQGILAVFSNQYESNGIDHINDKFQPASIPF